MYLAAFLCPLYFENAATRVFAVFLCLNEGGDLMTITIFSYKITISKQNRSIEELIRKETTQKLYENTKTLYFERNLRLF